MSEPDGGDGDATAGGGVAQTPASGGGRGPAGTTRPLVLPEPYDGTGSWREWSFHFENVATVNSWDDAQKPAVAPSPRHRTCPEGSASPAGSDSCHVRSHERRPEGAV